MAKKKNHPPHLRINTPARAGGDLGVLPVWRIAGRKKNNSTFEIYLLDTNLEKTDLTGSATVTGKKWAVEIRDFTPGTWITVVVRETHQGKTSAHVKSMRLVLDAEA